MANDTSLTYSLYGRDVSASKALQNVGKAADETGGHFSKIKDIAAGVFSANLMQNAASDVLNFAKSSINAFQDVGTEVKNLQRYTGGSAEDMSKLRFAAEEAGVSSDTLATALGKMAKAAATTAGEKKFEAIGVSVKDVNGNFKSASAIFSEVAGKIAAMPNGIAKTNDILQIFGKSGMQLAPLLNQGSAGIAKFSAEAQKMGLVLSQDNLDAVQKNIMAQREFHASVQGLQVQLGQYLYPAITAITKGFSEVVPVLMEVLKPAFKLLGEAISPVIGFISDLVKYITDLGDHFESTGGKASAFGSIGKSIGTVFNDVKTLFQLLLPVLKDVFAFVMNYLAPVFAVVLEGAFKAVAIAANVVVDVIKGIIYLVKAEINGVIDVINFAIDAMDKIHIKLPKFLGGFEFGIDIPKIPKLADGAIVNSPTIAMIGEAGPEAVVPLSKAGAGIGQGMNVTINVQGSVIAQKDLVAQVRNEMAQLLRRKGAPIAALGF